MKIGFDAKRYFHNKTGLGNYSRDLIRVLTKFYPENKYFLYNPKPSRNFSINHNSIKEINPNSPFAKKLKGLWRSFGISKITSKENLDVYHGLSGEIPIGLPKRIKKIVTIHDLIFIRHPNLYSFWDKKIHTIKFRYAVKKSNIIIAISEQTKADIVRYFATDPKKIKVIYQGCAPIFKEIFSKEEIELVQQKYNLPDKFLLNVGTLEDRKNALNIVKATKENNYPLVLIGRKTNYYNKIELFITENGMKNISTITCNQKELAIIYQLATIFVYPSIFEGFGIPIIEALYSKTPVITNKEGVFPEAGGPDSIYIDINNVQEIKTTIEDLWNNKKKREYIAQKGFEFAQKFNDDRIAIQTMKIYQDLQ